MFVQTFFVILLLGVGSVLFTTDSESLVIAPIERMVKTVLQIADDPLGNVQDSAVEAPSKRKAQGNISQHIMWTRPCSSSKFTSAMYRCYFRPQERLQAPNRQNWLLGAHSSAKL